MIKNLKNSKKPKKKGLVIAQYGNLLDIEDENKVVHRCKRKRNLTPIVTGDLVLYVEKSNEIYVEEVLERRSLLFREGDRGKKQPVAANIDQVLIVIAPVPKYTTYFLDQYILAAEVLSIEPIIVFNKLDLVENIADIEKELKIYTDLNYSVIKASTQDDNNVADVISTLNNKVSILVGQSGVGKSSLLRKIIPSEGIIVGDLSEKAGQGMHTTTAVRLYHLNEGGSLIDSPGIREFKCFDINLDKLRLGFREIFLAGKHCKFRDCKHLEEPACHVKELLNIGKINNSRYENYLKILEDIN